jgi:hypothetical protein
MLPVSAANDLGHDSGKISLISLTGTGMFTITGGVVDQNGTPVEDVQVFAFSGASQFSTDTQSSGQFTLTLGMGTYDVVFNPPPSTGLASQSRRGIHEAQIFNVILPPGHAISGVVYSDATKLNPVGKVAIFAFNKNTFDGFGLPPSQANGVYQISLEASTWELTFTPPPFMGLGPTQTTIILTQDVIQDIVLQPGFTVYGQVMTSSGGGQVGVEIFAQDPAQPNGYGFTPTEQAGVYTGTLPLGTFDILFFAPPFLGLGSTVITNVSGSPDMLLHLALPVGYTISGTIRCGNGLANAFVFAAPQPPISAGYFGGWGRFAGVDGFYALALQPGVYTLTVSPPSGSNLPVRIIPEITVQQDLTAKIGGGRWSGECNRAFCPASPAGF